MSTSSSSSFGEQPQDGSLRQNSAGWDIGLSPGSIRAVDKYFEEGADPADPRTDGVGRVANLLDALDLPAGEVSGNRELLVDLTLARVSRASRHSQTERTDTSFVDGDLSPDDDDALEALVEAGMDLSRVPSSMRSRAARQLSLLGMLDHQPADAGARDALVNRTLATVQEHIERDESRLIMAALPADDEGTAGLRTRFRMSDLVTVAAMVLVAFGVLAPITNAVQGYSQRLGCESNLNAAGLGFGLYAGSNKDGLPMATSSPVGAKWWFVGKGREQSNAANLYTLVRTGTTDLASLACRGNEHAVSDDPRKDADDWARLEEVSYSYQNMFASERPNWSTSSRTIVLVDRSPVIPKAFRGQLIDPMENSPNHDGRGQAALFNDGSVEWLRSPVMANGDNIWLPRHIEHALRQLTQLRAADPLKGDENPAAADDVFVGP